ncbi:metallophosphoesterase [Anaeromyxobacter sp. Fw109-5]|uniref:metallophosphoesterase n=1 Tax=Anaeromyxobacter sp. (strain Fw109-5) TaxID=404589 RepID=UPI000158A4B7|nr:metallophosphoesterase [Anaeromyxobacter sp. Fw109-5]ABS26722.1 metallophosphoesterase [Anaeromyxobacter sp. Fw109-5]
MRRAAVAAALAAVLAGCSPASPTFTVRSARARNPGPAPAIAGPFERVLHLADFGDPTDQQGEVARAVIRAHERAPFALGFFPGDNVYPCGPDVTAPGADACRFGDDGNTLAPGFSPPADPSFSRHDAPLARLAGPPAAEVYLALGNHDVATWTDCRRSGDPVAEGRLKACLEVAHRSPVWRMPGRHYAVERAAARFLVVDTNPVEEPYGGFALEDEVAFVRDQAAGCRADACESEPGGCERPWCFLVGHHPPVTAGSHRDDATPERLARMDELLAAGAGRIRAFLAGHDHDLQHLRSPEGLDVLVSGNGARGRPGERFDGTSVPGTEVIFATVRWGYGVLEVARDGWRYRFEDDEGKAVYCCAAVAGGRCEPVRCH